MSTIVSTLDQALENIPRFKTELEKSSELQRRLAFARAWYAVQDDNGEWHFAPSKFCGYEAMTAEEYVNDDPRDGRRTEKQLQRWFSIVPEGDDLFDELYEELSTFLARFGKPPSSAVRLNVLTDFFSAIHADQSDVNEQRIADLIVAVSRSLSAEQRMRIRAAL